MATIFWDITTIPSWHSALFLFVAVFGLFGALIGGLAKPILGLGKTVASRLQNPNRDIFGRPKDPGTPDPLQEGLRAATTAATSNIQGTVDTALSDIGLTPTPAKKSNIALIAVAILAILFITKK